MKTIVSICCATVITAVASTLSFPERVASIVDQDPTKPTIAKIATSLHQGTVASATEQSQHKYESAPTPRTHIGTSALTSTIVAQVSSGPAIFGLFGAAALTGIVSYRRFWLGKRYS